MKDTTLVIQGKLTEETYRFYCLIYPGVKKVFSTWVGNESNWANRADIHGPNDIFLRSKIPENHVSCEMNIDLQTISTLMGLRRVKTKYVIKLRGDEWYSNLEVVEKILKEDAQKIYTIPVFFRKWQTIPYHPSDHLMAGTTENMNMMFQNCLLNVLTKNDIGLGYPFPESILAKSYMDEKIGQISDPKEDFKKLFGIIPIDLLRYYKVRVNGMNVTWYSNFDPSNDQSLGSISCIDDL